MLKSIRNRTRSSSFRKGLLAAGAAFATLGLGFAPANADIIYQTNNPFGGFLGINGLDVFQQQSVAVRFTPSANYRLDRVAEWFMNNAESSFPSVRMTLRTDNAGAGSIPSETILEEWNFNLQTLGWDPLLHEQDSKLRPLLRQGKRYWLVAESQSPPFVDPVWNFAGIGNGVMSICNGSNCSWTPAASSGVVSVVITGTPAVTGDINADSTVNVDDLVSLLAAWGPCKQPDTCDADIAPAPGGDGQVNVDDLVLLLANWG